MSDRRAKQPHPDKTAELRHYEDGPEPHEPSQKGAPASEPGSAPGPVLDSDQVLAATRDPGAEPRPLFVRGCAALRIDPDQILAYRDGGDVVQFEIKGGPAYSIPKDRLPE